MGECVQTKSATSTHKNIASLFEQSCNRIILCIRHFKCRKFFRLFCLRSRIEFAFPYVATNKTFTKWIFSFSFQHFFFQWRCHVLPLSIPFCADSFHRRKKIVSLLSSFPLLQNGTNWLFVLACTFHVLKIFSIYDRPWTCDFYLS